MKKSKPATFIESLTNAYNTLYNSDHLYEDGMSKVPGGVSDPKAYQEMELVALIACLEEWLDTYGKKTKVKFNPKGVNLLDVIDIID